MSDRPQLRSGEPASEAVALMAAWLETWRHVQDRLDFLTTFGSSATRQVADMIDVLTLLDDEAHARFLALSRHLRSRSPAP